MLWRSDALILGIGVKSVNYELQLSSRPTRNRGHALCAESVHDPRGVEPSPAARMPRIGDRVRNAGMSLGQTSITTWLAADSEMDERRRRCRPSGPTPPRDRGRRRGATITVRRQAARPSGAASRCSSEVRWRSPKIPTQIDSTRSPALSFPDHDRAMLVMASTTRLECRPADIRRAYPPCRSPSPALA